MIIVSNIYVDIIKYKLGSDPPPPHFGETNVVASDHLMFELELPLYLVSVEEKESARLQDQEVQGRHHHHLHQLEQDPQVE